MAAASGGGRRAARERAVTLLYEAEQRDLSSDEVLAGEVLEPDPYTAAVLRGVDAEGERIDGVISRFAKGWVLERMAALDRAVLRVAVYELLHSDDVPVAVVINEAVELANTYSTDDSGRFVNGVLSAAAAELRS